ncbi:nonribosomal peptide synthetase 2 [Xylona heveae TC161]|uniref:Nonribosomal peptide synthetase 2 n=1 Tax=Xylona heveae (strain CBS 132557 / TC161) TaxID=1328760 RepID=A0A164ZXX5_XYLHT|nr:nonribosomal peptide synthetase 2 [Xylona heveae TC161]KZF19680.1 nonribosomal peptide synthetase 2 [Xylona heveae TC161]
MAYLRFTPFPDLCSSLQQKEPQVRSEQQWRTSIPSVAHDQLVVAWGLLLQAYTGEDEPAFLLDKEAVTVNAANLVYIRRDEEILDNESTRHTGLFFNLSPAPCHLALQLEYDVERSTGRLTSSGLLSPNCLAQVGQQLTAIMRSLITKENDTTYSYPTDCGEPLSILNKHPRLFNGPNMLHRLLEKHSEKEDCAIDFLEADGSHRTYSYAAVEKHSNNIALKLRTLLFSGDNASKQHIIPILIPQSPELYISIIGILKAGAAFCPLNLDAPQDRLQFICKDVCAKVLVTTQACEKRLSWPGCPQTVNIDLITEPAFEEREGEKRVAECIDLHQAGLAYVMYTSGSTGAPKGVGVSHAAASQALLAHDRHIPSFNRFLQFAAPTFDVFVFETFFPLYRGSVLTTCRRDQLLRDLPDTMSRLQVDAAELTPTVVSGLLRTRDAVPTLKVLLTIGEALPRGIIDEFGGSSSQQSILYAMYGPTEAAIHCTLVPRMLSSSKAGTIGVPLDTVSALIIPPHRPGASSPDDVQALPQGFVGELAVGGNQLADGYLNRPNKTKEAFIDTRHYGRIYRTGDKARLLADGCIEFLGRISSGQIKLRGQRVELGEIEEAATQTIGVRLSVALVIHGKLVVFCVADDNRVTSNDVLSTCRSWLPAFMVPADIVVTNEIPRLASGKVDRKALERDYQESQPSGTLPGDEELDEIEQKILETVQGILGSRISKSASLVSVGLDSLLAIKLASQLRPLGFDISAVDLLALNSVERIRTRCSPSEKDFVVDSKQKNAEHIWQERCAQTRHAIEDALGTTTTIADIEGTMPCTPLQVAMLSETARNPKAYCNWIELQVRSDVSIPQIKEAFQAVAKNNTILRSGFISAPTSTGPYVQVIWRDLSDTQFRQTEKFSYGFSLDGMNAYLRPLRVQIGFIDGELRILAHIHHALYDGWSWEHLLNDIGDLIKGKPLVERPQFQEVVKYNMKFIEGLSFSESKAFWQARLADITPSLLPNLSGREPAPPSFDIQHWRMETSPAKLASFSRKLGVGLQTCFQGALAYILSRYIGTSEVIVGNVFSGRTLPITGVEEIMGPCISTLPVPTSVLASQTIAEYLQNLHHKNREMLEFSTFPLGEIKKCSKMEPGQPLFDVLFVWQQTLQSEDDSRIFRQINSRDFLEFNLTLEVEPSPDQIRAKATFNESIIPQAHVEILLRQLDQLVSAFIDRSIERVSCLDSCFDQHALSIQSISDDVHDPPSPSTLFEATVQRAPGNIAITIANSITGIEVEYQSLTYLELDQRANQLAHFLLANSVQPDDLVCICMEKSLELYTSILAVIKSGAAYLPLTPETPRDRFKHILETAKVKLCLARSSSRTTLEIPESVVGINVDETDFGAFSSKNPVSPCNDSNIAYAVFTSGSTGTPKGVLVTRKNLSTNLEVLMTEYPHPLGSRLLQACSQAFDVSVFEIFFTWSTGMTLCSATNDVLFRDIEHAIRKMGITHLSLTPTVAGLIDPRNVPNVKFLVCAGESMTSKVFRSWAGRGLYQAYGPSETTNVCTLKSRVLPSDAINNIGQALRNTSALVIRGDSPNISPVPRGSLGEFCFGGDQVCRGYLNMPAMNSEKFFSHPELGKLYRTGDYGRMLHDGSLVFVGRADEQVKLRGQRIELGEINNCLLQASCLENCITMLVESHTTRAAQLVSFWIPSGSANSETRILSVDEGIKVHIGELNDRLKLTLPAYMQPAFLIPITQIPRTSQGKVDTRRLQSIFDGLGNEYLDSACQQQDESESGTAWSDLDLKILEAVSQVVGVSASAIRRHTSLFSLGLDSISAIALVGRLRESLSCQLDVSAILKKPTIASLAGEVIKLRQESKEAKTVSTDPQIYFDRSFLDDTVSIFEGNGKSVRKILPCTPLQDAMLSAAIARGNKAYFNHSVIEINGDMERLRKGWEMMVKRHDILRTCFVSSNSRVSAFAQVILDQCDTPWRVIEASPDSLGVAIDARKAEITTFMDKNAPPFALSVFRTSQGIHLLLSMHHALYDGRALSLLFEEVEHAYLGLELMPTVPFESFLEYSAGMEKDEADAFWERQLKDFTPTSFPDLTGKSARERRTLTGSSVARMVSALPLSKIQNECRLLSTTLLAVGQAAWAKLLSVYLGEEDICFGNIVSGRTIPLDGVDRIVAPCFNTLPVRVAVTQSPTNRDLAQKLHAINTSALQYQFTPLRRIQAKHGESGTHLFDTLFLLQQPQSGLDHSIWALEDDTGDMDFPVVCELIPNTAENTLQFSLYYYHSIMDDQDAYRILRSLDVSLSTSFDQPSTAPLDFSMFSHDLLSSSNTDFKTLNPLNGDVITKSFERNVALSPNELALDFLGADGQRTIWTFDQLNRYANRIANTLIARGTSSEEATPICLRKSPQFYASVLGVLKAGAAFTPIDPQAPSERKAFILQELGARTILSSSEIDLSWCDVSVVDVDIVMRSDGCATNPNIPYSPSSLAYRLYTSGSTGQPKAVSVEHRNAIQTIESSRSALPWERGLRFLQFAAITFDMCYYDCFLAWNFGLALCAAPQSTLLNDLASVINRLNVDMLDLTPTVASTLARSAVPSVKCLYCIGEAMPQKLADEWDGLCLNSYGPTEAAMCCTVYRVQPDIKSSVIGIPFPTTSFTVISRISGCTVPTYGIGELLIGGGQVARNYHANKKLTKAQFIIGKDGQRKYKSGDLVRMLGNGLFEFIGRADDQVKIRGQRVELDEINAVIKAGVDGIRDVSTQVLKQSTNTKEQLVSFLATGSSFDIDRAPTVKDCARKAASRKLPSYMVPTIFVVLDNIPLSAAGKVNKRALLETFQKEQESSLDTQQASDANAPESHDWSPEEQQVRSILSTLSGLQKQQMRRDTTIYQLGLDSISAVQIASSLRDRGYQASVGDILKGPSIEQISTTLRADASKVDLPIFNFERFEKENGQSVRATLGNRQVELEAIRPCTPIQSGMIAQFIHSQGHMYFNHLVLEFDSSIDTNRVLEAWQAAAVKFEILRTGFVKTSDRQYPFAMVTYKAAALPVLCGDLGTSSSPLATLRRQRQDIGRRVLDNLHLPPWHLTTVRTQEGKLTLQLSAHHALYDAHSLNIILNDIQSYYHTGNMRSTPSLNPVLGAILAANEDDTEQEIFWRGMSNRVAVSKFPNLTPLRVSANSSPVLTKVCSELRTKLEYKCRTLGITLQAAGQAAWARVLSAYTGEFVVTFGSVFSGRTLGRDAELAVFPCISTLPIPVQATGSNLDLLRQVMETNARLIQHQFTPLPKIQHWTGNPSRTLFDTLFVYQKISEKRQIADFGSVVDEQASVDYAISIEMEPLGAEDVEFRITFKEDLIPPKQASILLDQLHAVLLDTLNSPHNDCSDMTNLNPALLSVVPPKQPTLSSEVELLHQFVELHALRTPGKVAFEFATDLHSGNTVKRQWTYQQLDEEGNRVAHLIQKYGASPGDLVGICFDKCPEASFAILGIMKAGCAYVALDPSAPIARKGFIIKDSQARLIVTTTDLTHELRENVEVPVLSLDGAENASGMPSRPPTLSRQICASDACYCLYTSGTTGTPKGCELTHENAVQAMLAFRILFYPHWDEQSRWLQFASFHFDVSVLEQFWSWSVGICVCSAPRELIFEDIAGAIRELEVTHIDLTPSLARILHPDDVPSLCRGVFITGGEQLKQEILDAWGPKQVIYNGYGPTEATIGVTMYPRVPENGKPSNIGKQFENVGSYVFRPGSTMPVLRGAVGELCVSGKLVGRGYLNRPELTRDRFQYLEQFSERVYRTGDLVRTLHDETFDFLGRSDDQVKLRGQRLEIGEINDVIKRASDSIEEVATLVVRHPQQQKEQLVSFVVSKDWKRTNSKDRNPLFVSGFSKEMGSIFNACKAKLPGYMIPTHFLPLTSIPLSPNNKADARRLKDIYCELSISELQNLTTAGSEDEEQLVGEEEIIAQILLQRTGLEGTKVTKASTIFELGLDSISVIEFANELKRVGFVGAHSMLILQNPALGQLVKALASKEGSDTTSDEASLVSSQRIRAFAHRHTYTACEALGLPQDSVESIAPCTPLQEGMIYRALESDKGLYFAAFRYHVKESLNWPALKEAWTRVLAYTQILRTKFALTADGYAQVALKSMALPWQEVFLPSSEDIGAVSKQYYSEWHSNSRSLEERPFELVIFRSGSQTWMCIHIFHALYDGISLPMILDRVLQEYNGEDGITYGPPFQQVLALGPLKEPAKAKDFWTRHLKLCKYQELPPIISQPSATDSFVSRDFLASKQLETVRRRLNVTAQSLIQACWATVLQRIFNAKTVTFGLVVSGRSAAEQLTTTIGPLFNTIPFAVTLEESESGASLVQKCHKLNMEALQYQHTPLRNIAKWCQRTPDHPLFNTLFVFQKEVDSPTVQPELLWTPLEDESQADYPIALEAHQKADGVLRLTLSAQKEISNNDTSIQLLIELDAAIARLIHDMDSTVSLSLSNGHAPERDVSGENTTQEDKNLLNGSAANNTFQWSPTAEHIRGEIADLAGVEATDINEHSTIFELGLDSIDAIKLSSRLKRKGLHVSVGDILKALTVPKITQKLSGAIITNGTDNGALKVNEYRRLLMEYLSRNQRSIEDIEDILPITPLQEAMLADMLTTEFSTYFNHDVLEIAPTVDVRRLRSSCAAVVQNSPILRTAFLEIDDPAIPGTYAQMIQRSSPNPRTCQMVSLDEDDTFDKIFEFIKRDVMKCMQDIPPFRITVVTGAEKNYLVLSLAHALYDGWSIGLLHEDIHRAYHESYNPRPPYNTLIEEIVAASGDEAEKFWANELSGVSPTCFGEQDKPIREQGGLSRDECTASLGLEKVQSFCKQFGVNLQALGLTCWSIVLGNRLHKLDIVFGTVLSGRNSEEAQEIMFPAMNTVPVRVVLHGTGKEMVQYLQETSANMMQYQHFPLRRAQALAKTDGRRLFDSLFIYQKGFAAGINDGTLYHSVNSFSNTEYPVCVEMEASEGDLVWRAACQGNSFDAASTRELLQDLDQALFSIISDPDSSILDVQQNKVTLCGLSPFTIDDFTADPRPGSSPALLKQPTKNTHWSPTEMTVREVLASVARIPSQEISKDTTIFHLGLDSISAIKLASQLKKHALRIKVGDILKAGTVEGIARLAGSEGAPDLQFDAGAVLLRAVGDVRGQEVVADFGFQQDNIERIAPATPGQSYFLTSWQNTRGSLFYATFSYIIRKDLSACRLEEAWQTLVDRSALLRSTFVSSGSTRAPFLQITFKSYKNSIVWVPASDKGIFETHRKVDFKLPPVTLFAYKDDNRVILNLQIHHALYDGVSLPALLRSLEVLCNNVHAAVDLQADMDDSIAFFYLEEAQVKRREFWANYLTEQNPRLSITKPLEAPHRTQVFCPNVISKVHILESLVRENGLSIQALFLAVYARVYAGLVQHSQPGEPAQVVFGMYLANRSHWLEKTSNNGAPTVNFVPLRVSHPLDGSIMAMAQQVHKDLQNVGSLENSAVSLWEIFEWTGVKIDSFVNFLKLPGADDINGVEPDTAKAGISIEECIPSWSGGTKTVVRDNVERFTDPLLLKNNPVKEVLPPAIDIEASITADSLDVGIFGSTELVDIDEAESAIKQIGNILKAVQDTGDHNMV